MSGEEPQHIKQTSSDSTGHLDVPESRDGFFGYSEEKSLQHVSMILWADLQEIGTHFTMR